MPTVTLRALSLPARARSRLRALGRQRDAADIAGAAADGPAAGPAGAAGSGASPGEAAACARALYETSAVPVREIARLFGVCERTLYKHAARGGWARRHRRIAADGGETGKLRQACEGSVRKDLAPGRGAGGRFVRREDIGRPHESGLCALDPERAARGADAGRRALALSQLAVAQARADLDGESGVRALSHLVRALREFLAMQREGRPAPRHRPHRAPKPRNVRR